MGKKENKVYYGKAPKNPKKGDILITDNGKGREITMEATGLSGFGKWKIKSNKDKSKSERR
jgi:hypothetical protein